MRIPSKPLGFSAFETVIVILVLAIIGLTGYLVYGRWYQQPTATSTATSTSDTSGAPTINTVSDLDTALKVLDQNDPSATNGTDSSQLTTEQQSF